LSIGQKKWLILTTRGYLKRRPPTIYVKEYMSTVSGYLREIEIGFEPLAKHCKPNPYPEWAPLTEDQKKEIVDRAKKFLCKELLDKKRKWGSAFHLTKWVTEDPIFIEARCEGFEPSDYPAKPADTSGQPVNPPAADAGKDVEQK
jgi:hypothetical protein